MNKQSIKSALKFVIRLWKLITDTTLTTIYFFIAVIAFSVAIFLISKENPDGISNETLSAFDLILKLLAIFTASRLVFIFYYYVKDR